MRKLLVKLGKDFGSNEWGIVFVNKTHTLGFPCQEGFPQTVPYPGAILEEDAIKQMIEFLQQTIMEIEDHEQSDVE